MAKKIYVGVNGKARKVRKMYVGVGGSAHKVKKGYIGVNGVARLFFTSGKPLSQYAEGAIIKINEGGKPAEFYVAKHNYESSLNGNGRTLVVRKEAGVKKQFHSKTFDVQYSGSDIDNWLINDYKNSLVQIITRDLLCLISHCINKDITMGQRTVSGLELFTVYLIDMFFSSMNMEIQKTIIRPHPLAFVPHLHCRKRFC